MGIYDGFKDIVKVVKDLDNIELYKRILEIQSQMNELYENNLHKSERIKELEELLSITDKIEFRNSFYYFKGEDDPLCTGCWEGNKKVVHLLGESGRSQHCPICDNKYVMDESSNIRNIRKNK